MKWIPQKFTRSKERKKSVVPRDSVLQAIDPIKDSTIQNEPIKDNSSLLKNSTMSTLVNEDLNEWLAILVNNSFFSNKIHHDLQLERKPIKHDQVKERLEIAAAKRNAIKQHRLKEQMDLAWFETMEMIKYGDLPSFHDLHITTSSSSKST
ncbi:unnamed protein product [Rhizopus stolonifer]